MKLCEMENDVNQKIVTDDAEICKTWAWTNFIRCQHFLDAKTFNDDPYRKLRYFNVFLFSQEASKTFAIVLLINLKP